jgi:hypothetical protein
MLGKSYGGIKTQYGSPLWGTFNPHYGMWASTDLFRDKAPTIKSSDPSLRSTTNLSVLLMQIKSRDSDVHSNAATEWATKLSEGIVE